MHSCFILVVFSYSLLLRYGSSSQYVVNPIADHYHSDYLQLSDHFQLDPFMRNNMDEWKPLGLHEALNYFTSFEVCQGFNQRRLSWCQDHFVNDLGQCDISNSGAGVPGAVCPNLNGVFYRHVSMKTYPETRTLLDLIYLLLKNGYDQLFLWGDSVTRQHQGELFCQLKRFGVPGLSWNTTKIVIPNVNKLFKEYSRVGYDSSSKFAGNSFISSTFSIDYLDMNGLWDFQEKLPVIKNFLSFQRSGSSVIVFNLGLHVNLNQDDPVKNATELRKSYKEVFDYLLHTEVEKKNQLVFFRETSAQHFQTPDGSFRNRSSTENLLVPMERIPVADDPIRNMFSGDKLKQPIQHLHPHHQPHQKHHSSPKNNNHSQEQTTSQMEDAALYLETVHTDMKKRFVHPLTTFLPLHCRPIPHEKAYHEQNWRNRIAIEELVKIDPGHEKIPIIPFYHHTAARFDVHLQNDNDCTHFCYGPMLWSMIGVNILETLEKKFV
jgi:hypothetical protein